MDRYVKTMIKFTEEDEDSFARRAEIHRALAERRDHSVSALRKAHRTITFNVRPQLDKEQTNQVH